jgi:hypothetical protein
MKSKGLQIFLASSLVLLSSCGLLGASEKESFESLLVLVESSESILESEKLNFAPAQAEFLECLNSGSGASWTCESERGVLESVFDQTLVRFGFQREIAELNALRLSDNDDASLARDAFVKHLRAWRQYISDYRYSLPTSTQLYSNDLSFFDVWLDIYENNEISKTFDQLCSGLGNAQPSDVKDFTDRIVDICDE